MDFNQVRYFLALAEMLNFTRAAERCYVSQPALTQGIKRLEEELGGELVVRDGRYTKLTELGSGLREHFERLNRSRHRVRQTAKSIVSGDLATLNIGVVCTVGPTVLAEMLNGFKANNPMISLVLHDVTPQAIPNMLLTGRLDAVFCTRQGLDGPRMRYVDLFEEQMVVAFPPKHEFVDADTVTLKDLVGQPFIERLHCEYRQQIHDFAEEHQIEFDVVFQSEREDWIQSMVRDGIGVSLIPRLSISQPELEFRPLVEPTMSRTVTLAASSDAELTPALERLLKEAASYHWAADTGQEIEPKKRNVLVGSRRGSIKKGAANRHLQDREGSTTH